MGKASSQSPSGKKTARKGKPARSQTAHALPVEDERLLKKAAELFLAGIADKDESTTPVTTATKETPVAAKKTTTAKASAKRLRETADTDANATAPRKKDSGPNLKRAKKAAPSSSHAGGFFVPLEEGGDAEDEQVSREVLARTAAFMSGLSATKKDSFWSLRGAATGMEEKKNDKKGKGNPAGTAKAVKKAVAASRSLTKTVNSGKSKQQQQQHRAAKVRGDGDTDEDAFDWDESESFEEDEEDGGDDGSSVTSSEPSWIPESDDDEYFGRIDNQATQKGKGPSTRSAQEESSEEDEEDDGIWSDDDDE